MEWFSTKGQIVQTIVPTIPALVVLIGLFVAARYGEPAMTSGQFSSAGAIIFYFIMVLVSGLSIFAIFWRRPKRVTASAPLVKSEDDLPVHFGSPVQRSKDEDISEWNVPIRIDDNNIDPKKRSQIGRYQCSAYLDEYVRGEITQKIELTIGGAGFAKPAIGADLDAGRVYLVPVAWRSEREKDPRSGYIKSTLFVEDFNRCPYAVPGNREKRRYRLRVKCAHFECGSLHFYLLRVPRVRSNGHFVLEKEYEGEGSQ